jgi:hypothetical protein
MSLALRCDLPETDMRGKTGFYGTSASSGFGAFTLCAAMR